MGATGMEVARPRRSEPLITLDLRLLVVVEEGSSMGGGRHRGMEGGEGSAGGEVERGGGIRRWSALGRYLGV